MNMTPTSEAVFNLMLTGLAEGGTREEIMGTARRLYGRRVSYHEFAGIFIEARKAALASGVDRCDMDPSGWGPHDESSNGLVRFRQP